MTEEEARQKAEKHWEFLEKWLHMMFVDAWMHSWKHTEEAHNEQNIC